MDFAIGRPIVEEPYKSSLTPDEMQLSLIAGTFNPQQHQDEILRSVVENSVRTNTEPSNPTPTNDNPPASVANSPMVGEINSKFDSLLGRLRGITQATPAPVPETFVQPTVIPEPKIDAVPSNEKEPSLYDILMGNKTNDVPAGANPPVVTNTPVANPQQNFSENDVAVLSNMIESQKQSMNTIDSIFSRAKQRGFDVNKVYEFAQQLTPDSFLDYVQFQMQRTAPRPPVTIANSPTYRGAVAPTRGDSGVRSYSTTTIRV